MEANAARAPILRQSPRGTLRGIAGKADSNGLSRITARGVGGTLERPGTYPRALGRGHDNGNRRRFCRPVQKQRPNLTLTDAQPALNGGQPAPTPPYAGQGTAPAPGQAPAPRRGRARGKAPRQPRNRCPRKLGPHGQHMWDEITTDYDIGDSGGIQLLTLACQALDRAEKIRSIIDKQGELIQNRVGNWREHPGLKAELANRAFIVRTLTRLGLSFEPVRDGVGRPSGRSASIFEGENF
jgi:hypothetical protein